MIGKKTGFLAGIFTLLFLMLAPSRSNAMEFEFERDPSLPIVYINVVVKSGSASDPEDRSGLTNFLAEMLLRGTQKHSKAQIDEMLDTLGARLDADTRLESLVFRGAVLSSQLKPFLSLLEEILTQPKFTSHEVKKLKSEVISGLQEELGHDPSLGQRRFNRFLFKDHPYGKPVLGTMNDIEKITLADLNTHYNRIVRGPSLLILGSGDAPQETVQKFAQDLDQQRPALAGASKETQNLTVPTNEKTRRLLIVDKPDRTQTQINLGQIGVRMTDPEFFPLYIGNYAFGGHSFSSTLMIEIRIKRGWSYGANSNFRHGLLPRSWSLHVFPAEKDAAAALEYSLKLLEELQVKGITREHFELAQSSLINSSGFMYNTPRKRIENTLLEKTLHLPDGFIRSYGEELKKVNYEEVNSSLKKFLKPESISIAVVGTAKNLKTPLAKAAKVPLEQVVVKPYTEE